MRSLKLSTEEDAHEGKDGSIALLSSIIAQIDRLKSGRERCSYLPPDITAGCAIHSLVCTFERLPLPQKEKLISKANLQLVTIRYTQRCFIAHSISNVVISARFCSFILLSWLSLLSDSFATSYIFRGYRFTISPERSILPTINQCHTRLLIRDQLLRIALYKFYGYFTLHEILNRSLVTFYPLLCSFALNKRVQCST